MKIISLPGDPYVQIKSYFMGGVRLWYMGNELVSADIFRGFREIKFKTVQMIRFTYRHTIRSREYNPLKIAKIWKVADHIYAGV